MNSRTLIDNDNTRRILSADAHTSSLMISESDSDDEEIVITGDNRITVPNGRVVSAGAGVESSSETSGIAVVKRTGAALATSAASKLNKGAANA